MRPAFGITAFPSGEGGPLAVDEENALAQGERVSAGGPACGG